MNAIVQLRPTGFLYLLIQGLNVPLGCESNEKFVALHEGLNRFHGAAVSRDFLDEICVFLGRSDGSDTPRDLG